MLKIGWFNFLFTNFDVTNWWKIFEFYLYINIFVFTFGFFTPTLSVDNQHVFFDVKYIFKRNFFYYL